MKKYLQLTLAVLVTATMTGCQKETMKLKKDTYQVEYGQQISDNVSTYLDNSQEYMKDVSLKGIPDSKNKEYPEVGEYKLTLSNNEESKQVKVTVKDTTAPTFENMETKVMTNGTKLESKNFKAKDNSQVTVTIDDSKVNYKKDGNYKATVTATDKYGNKTSKELTVTVKLDKKNEKSSSSKTQTSKKESTQSNGKTSQNSNKTQITKKPTSQSSNQNNTSSQSKPSSKPSNTKPSGNTNTSKPSGNTGSSSNSSQNQDLWVSKLDVAKNYSKIMIASAPSSSSRTGTFRYYQKVNGKWKEVINTSAHFGKAGLGTGSEYSTKTPVGQYTFTKLMGIASNPGTKLSYHKIDNNDYWCGEALYNQFVDEDVTGHNCSKKNDEHLIDYTSSYKYAAAFSYNPGNVKGKGFAFFLHCANNINYTGGCVAIPTSHMKKVMQSIDNDTVFIIDLEKNLKSY